MTDAYAEFRSHFPILQRQTYLNSCSQGALSIEVEQAFHRFLESWHEHGSPWEEWVTEVEALRTAFGVSVGADSDEIAVVPSASVGISSVASSFDYGERAAVVLGDFEFPTMGQIWLAQARRGAEIRWARARADRLGAVDYEPLVDDRTLIVPVTHVCYKNGVRLDIPRLVQLCHEHGALVFLDDYQRTGTGPIDVHALDVDFMVTGALKYLLGPSGIAFLYVRRDLLQHFEPTITGWFGRENPFAFRHDLLDWSPSARRFEGGTPPMPNAYATRAGLQLLESLGYDQVEHRIRALVRRFIAGAKDAGYNVLTPSDEHERGPLVVIRCTDAATVVQRLQARGIICSSRGNGLRVSFHAYNNEGDVDTVLEALKDERALLAEPVHSV